MNFKKLAILIIIFAAGIAAGGYLLGYSQPRSFLAISDCKGTCLNPNELLGLLGSVAIQKTLDFIPFVVKETDKTVVIKAPFSQAPIHYIVIPKKDIKDAADISETDKEYLIDAYAVMAQIIIEKGLKLYKIYTNGPGYQTVNYLHFHLLSDNLE